MADSSLDDFFAKKDKSKKKSKSKMTPADVLAKADEGPKKEKKKKDKEQPGGLGLSTTENTSKKRAVRNLMEVAWYFSGAFVFDLTPRGAGFPFVYLRSYCFGHMSHK